MITAIKNYVVGSYLEMKKVSWPTREQTINYSILVIGLTVGMAVFFALLDSAFSAGITALLTK